MQITTGDPRWDVVFIVIIVLVYFSRLRLNRFKREHRFDGVYESRKLVAACCFPWRNWQQSRRKFYLGATHKALYIERFDKSLFGSNPLFIPWQEITYHVTFQVFGTSKNLMFTLGGRWYLLVPREIAEQLLEMGGQEPPNGTTPVQAVTISGPDPG